MSNPTFILAGTDRCDVFKPVTDFSRWHIACCAYQTYRKIVIIIEWQRKILRVAVLLPSCVRPIVHVVRAKWSVVVFSRLYSL